MKPEQFDEAIRKKLEPFHPRAREQDVNRVFNYVSRKQGYIFGRFNWTHLTYFSLGVFVGGLIMWNIIRIQHSNKMELTIQNVPANAVQVESPVSSGDIKMKDEEIIIKDEEIKALPQVKSSLSNVDDSEILSEKNENIISSAGSPDLEGNTHVPLREIAQISLIPITTVKEDKQTPELMGLPERGPAVNQDKTLMEEGRNAEQEMVLIADDQKKHARSNERDKKTGSMEDRIKQPKGLKKTNNQSRQNVSGQHIIMDLTVKTGLAPMISSENYGAGIVGELQAGNHWSFLTGLSGIWFYRETFKDDKDFSNRKLKDFEHFYGHSIGEPHGEVKNIQLNQFTLQLPLIFRYYFPMQKGTSLSFGLGTGLNIYTNHCVHYDDYPEPDSSRIRRAFECRQNVPVFNHLGIYTGIDKRWSKLVLRANPFFSIYWKENPKSGWKTNAGLEVQVLWLFPLKKSR
jgi:hypothetical protein